MSNLTPAFTALDPPYSAHYSRGPHVFTDAELQESLVPSYRRSLTFPLYRSFTLAERCRKDVAALLQKGKRTVMRCLLEMKDILDHHEVYYIYSKIWLDDFCVWIQAEAQFVILYFYPLASSLTSPWHDLINSDEVLKMLGDAVLKVKVDKALIGWDLDIIENAALHAEDRETDSDDESSESD